MGDEFSSEFWGGKLQVWDSVLIYDLNYDLQALNQFLLRVNVLIQHLVITKKTAEESWNKKLMNCHLKIA